MMSCYRETYVNIDMNNLIYNIEYIYRISKKPLLAIIKANAYGHGDFVLAKELENHPQIYGFGVATLKEAIDLKQQGIKKPILVIGTTLIEDVKHAIMHHITITAYSLEFIQQLATLKLDNVLKVHIKVDSGMNRLGLKTKEEMEKAYQLLKSNPMIDIEGVFTHFASVDDDELSYINQLTKFKNIIEGYHFQWIHADNSVATMYYHDDFTNMDRLGIGMYGIDPKNYDNPHLKQVMSLYTTVMMVKKIHKGEKVGYNFTYTASNDEYIATLPIGYADGLIRKNQGRSVWIHGKKYEIVGRICMDQMMVRVDSSVRVGDKVEIFGENISLVEMANELQTIPYEILCLLSMRIERRYIR